MAELFWLGIPVVAAMVAWGVFGRYVLNDTPTWVEAMALWLMAWLKEDGLM